MAKKTAGKTKDKASADERVKRGQSVARGDTGNGDTGVDAGEQGISNRKGDRGKSAGRKSQSSSRKGSR